MKKLIAQSVLIGLTAAALSGCCAGCSSTPVPTTKLKATVSGQECQIENPKNTVISNLVFEVSTNHTARLSIGSLSSVNDPQTISNAYNGAADLANAVGAQINQGVQNGANAAGQFVGGAAKAVAK